MTSNIFSGQRGTSSRGGRSSRGASAAGPMQNLGWVPIALGAAAVVAGLGGRKKGAAAFKLTAVALTAAAGASAVSAMRSAQSGRGKTGGEPEVERSITIGKTADELRQHWLDPRTLPQIMAGFATVRATGDGRMHWKVEGPLGHTHEWDTETVDRSGEGIGWRSLSDGAVSNEGWIRFHPAPAGRGTVATLRFRFEPPGGALGDWVLDLLGTTPLDLVAEGVLRRFKNLVESGEIPTTARQPAARADTH
jgi:uncharacterized membrane protein